MRVRLSSENLKLLFLSLHETTGNCETIALKIGVPRRSINNWRQGKFLMALKIFRRLTNVTGLSKEILPVEILQDFWNTPKSGRKGAYAKMQLHGNPGTREGRKKGGTISITTHQKNDDYKKSFLLRLLDTDGCVYLDRHVIKGKIYQNIGWTITSYADTLRAEVYEALQVLGFSPTLTTPNLSVFLRQKNDIRRYFEEIGTHNEKHKNRYQCFLKQRGDVA